MKFHPNSARCPAPAILLTCMAVSSMGWVTETQAADKPVPASPTAKKPATKSATPTASSASSKPAAGALSPSKAPPKPTAALGTTADKPRVEKPTAPEGDDSQARARSLYEAGARAFAKRQNAAAIVYFRRAVALLPNPKLTYNIGLAYEDMGDPGNAIFHYLAYLQKQPHSDMRQEVLQRINRLEQQLAVSGVQQIVVSTAPNGALILVDGKPQGVTPYSGQFPPGSHELSLRLPGYRQHTTTVHLQPDHAFEVRVSLQSEMNEALDASEAPGLSHSLRPLTWSLLGMGAASLASGFVFEMARADSQRKAEQIESPTEAARFGGAAEAHQIASVSLMSFGSALLLAGTVLALDDWAASDGKPSSTALSLHLPCVHQFCGVGASGRF